MWIPSIFLPICLTVYMKQNFIQKKITCFNFAIIKWMESPITKMNSLIRIMPLQFMHYFVLHWVPGVLWTFMLNVLNPCYPVRNFRRDGQTYIILIQLSSVDNQHFDSEFLSTNEPILSSQNFLLTCRTTLHIWFILNTGCSNVYLVCGILTHETTQVNE